MKKRILSMLCALAIAASLATGAFAYTSPQNLAADTLYTLGLVRGTGSGYELSAAPTRAEAVTMAIRLSGAEQEALNGEWTTPFTDVPDWAQKYVGYAYNKGITSGTSATTFGASTPATANEFCTFILRMMGYSEAADDFRSGSAATTCYARGITNDSYSAAKFTRGDMFSIALNALTADTKADTTLIANLVANGSVSSAAASALGLSGNVALTARQISDRYSSRTFFLKAWHEDSDTAKDPDQTASGFFISADGLAVTNYHSIDEGVYATVTTLDGKTYPVTAVVYYSAEIDVAVLRVSQTAISGGTVSAFPYFEMLPSSTVRNGDVVYALGSPLGLQNSISSGIVGNRARAVSGYALPMIQNTAAISSGSSGGALLNQYGQVIGITTGAFVYGNSMFIAVPLDTVLMQDLSQNGRTLNEVNTIQSAKRAEAAQNSENS